MRRFPARPVLRQLSRACSRALSSSSSSSGGASSCPAVPPAAVVGGQKVPFEPKKHGPDEPDRLTCTKCGFIYYDNPLIVTGTVATSPDPTTGEDLVLLCRRAIAPRTGYMEKGESMQDSAKREAWEEAYARLGSLRLLSMYDIAHIGQVHIYWTARLLGPDMGAGPESLEVKLFRFHDIPWDELAFPTVSWALMHYHQSLKGGDEARPYFNPELRGHEGSTNVWWRPDRGLYYDDKWLRGSPPPTAEAP